MDKKKVDSRDDCWPLQCDLMDLPSEIHSFKAASEKTKVYFAPFYSSHKISRKKFPYVIIGHCYSIHKHSPATVVEKRFNELAKKWKKETGHYSTMIHVTRNENYLRIIALGKPVIPYILKDLEKEPEYWFEALRLLTNCNPVSKNHLGDLEQMTADWLNWGRKERLI